jgi:hypothetical protein
MVVHMTGARADTLQAMIDRHVRVAVIAQKEVTTDIPEYADLNRVFPGTEWNSIRGVSATSQRPAVSCGEENLLCLQADLNHGVSMLVVTFAYTLHMLGISPLDSTFDNRLKSAYDAALAAGLWSNTYASTNTVQYFARGMEDWFDAGRRSIPADGAYNEINTRAGLIGYDPALASLLADYLPNDDWRPVCP